MIERVALNVLKKSNDGDSNMSKKYSDGIKTIDVHGLFIHEAIAQTEQALRETLQTGGSTLRVIVGRGNHSRDGVPKLKPAIMRVMTRWVHPRTYYMVLT